jgi:hypothetical protein
MQQVSKKYSSPTLFGCYYSGTRVRRNAQGKTHQTKYWEYETPKGEQQTQTNARPGQIEDKKLGCTVQVSLL